DLLYRFLEPDTGFLLLSELMLQRNDAAALEEFVDATTEVSNGSVALIQGELALVRQDYEAAESRFQAAIENLSDEDPISARARKGFRLAMHRQGKSVGAYQRSPDKRTAFEELVSLVAADKDAEAC